MNQSKPGTLHKPPGHSREGGNLRFCGLVQQRFPPLRE
jgi:hypothetical protein